MHPFLFIGCVNYVNRLCEQIMCYCITTWLSSFQNQQRKKLLPDTQTTAIIPPHTRHRHHHFRMFQSLAAQTLLLGIGTGACIGGVFMAFRIGIVATFTSDPETASALPTRLWALLCAFQVVNGATFVYDGLLYALQAFAFVRNVMLTGTLLVFVPVLVGLLRADGTLFAVWAAKGALNVWRCATAAARVHVAELTDCF